MINVIIELSRYLIIILMVIYTFSCFSVFRYEGADTKKYVFARQNTIMFAMHFIAYLVIFLKTNRMEIPFFYFAQVIFLASTLSLYHVIYPKASKLVINNMCFLLSISFIILTRLSYDRSVKQFKIVVFSSIIALFIPFIIRKIRFLGKLYWVYAGIGLALLTTVAIAGRISYGAKISFSFSGISLQPSEFVKIVFVFFAASMLVKADDLRNYAITTVIAGIHILILVLSKDLGGALIYFVTYLMMLYVASKKPLYLIGGLLSGSAAAMLAYRLFYHVRVRVLAWNDPWSVIDKEGYQITQSLFAIGTGGWLGMGLYQGLPGSIPVVSEDFIFSAISEELGGIFSLCLILVCVSCFIMFMNIAMQIKDPFFMLAALGLGIVYGFQVFMTIGGVTKFIPLTGVTLPLVSYGGSSVLSTLIMFAVIQGFYIYRENEEEDNLEKERLEKKFGKAGREKKKTKAEDK